MIGRTEAADAPRRYFVDTHGNRVLIGLSLDETAEFEALDGSGASAERRGGTQQMRWRELYVKHDGAWKAWIAQSRAKQATNSTFVNCS